MIKEALAYLDQGVSVIPVKDKIPTIDSWDRYKKTLMTSDEVGSSFKEANGIATIGGVVSGGREMIDIDCKYDLTGKLWEEYSEMIKTHDKALFDALVIVKTPSNGYHLIYRVEGDVIGNTKLARRYATKAELDAHPMQKVKVLIETKAEGGYCVAPPTAGYTFVSKARVPVVITAEQKDLIITLAKSFNEVFDEVVNVPKRIRNFDDSKFVESPFEDYNNRGDALTELVKHGWTVVGQRGHRIQLKRPGDSQSKSSGNYSTEFKTFKCFSTSTCFSEEKAYSQVGVYCQLNHNGDWAKCAKDLLANGFGKERVAIDPKYVKKIASMKRHESDDDSIIDAIKKVGQLSTEKALQVLKDYEANQGKNVMQFWTITPPDKEGKKPIIKIHLNKFTDFISSQLDIYRFRMENGSFTYVRVSGGIIEEVEMTDIKDEIKKYIESLDLVFDGIQRDDLMELIQKQSKQLFSDDQMEFLEYTDVTILQSDKETAYFPFKNKVARVSVGAGVELVPYSEIRGNVVWKKSIIDHDLEFINSDELSKFSFSLFLSAINGQNEERYQYCCRIIGYLLHDYKDPTEPRCVIFGEETNEASAGGGTGKGLLTTAIGKMVKSVSVDGKNFDASKTFAFQRVALGDKLILLQDTAKQFDFEKFFSKLTDGLAIEKKNQNEIYIPYKDSPKFLITTNYTINNESAAAKRRQYLLEFSSFFSETRTPVDYLKEYLFEGWNTEKWNKFYSLMLCFCYYYLRDGVPNMLESNSSIEKRISTSYGDEFYAWFIGYVINDFTDMSTLYNSFLAFSQMNRESYSDKRFNLALKTSTKLIHKTLEKRQDPITRRVQYKW